MLRASVVRIEFPGEVQTVVSTGASSDVFQGIAVDTNGDYLVPNVDRITAQGSILRVDPLTGSLTPVSSGGMLACPRDIALEADGNLIVANADYSKSDGKSCARPLCVPSGTAAH